MRSWHAAVDSFEVSTAVSRASWLVMFPLRRLWGSRCAGAGCFLVRLWLGVGSSLGRPYSRGSCSKSSSGGSKGAAPNTSVSRCLRGHWLAVGGSRLAWPESPRPCAFSGAQARPAAAALGAAAEGALHVAYDVSMRSAHRALVAFATLAECARQLGNRARLAERHTRSRAWREFSGRPPAWPTGGPRASRSLASSLSARHVVRSVSRWSRSFSASGPGGWPLEGTQRRRPRRCGSQFALHVARGATSRGRAGGGALPRQTGRDARRSPSSCGRLGCGLRNPNHRWLCLAHRSGGARLCLSAGLATHSRSQRGRTASNQSAPICRHRMLHWHWFRARRRRAEEWAAAMLQQHTAARFFPTARGKHPPHFVWRSVVAAAVAARPGRHRDSWSITKCLEGVRWAIAWRSANALGYLATSLPLR